MKKYLLKRLWFIPLGLAAALLTAVSGIDPAVTDAVYSRGVYPWLSSIWGFLPSLVPFSVAQWVVIAFAGACAAFAVMYVRAFIRARDGRALIVWKAVATALAVLSVGYLIFTLMCGINYHRLTFAASAGIEVRESSVDELAALCEDLQGNLNETRALIDGSPETYAQSHGGFETYAHGAVENMSTLAQTYPALERPLYSPPKPVLLSILMSYADITGMYFPFTVESNINVDVPFFTIPATMGHELAHQCGFMREDEANFIGYLSCLESDDPLVRYSGYSLAWDYAISALNGVDPERARELTTGLSDEVREDRRERSAYWRQFEGPVAEISNAANDAYLKANSQTDGTRSYGRMVDLLLAWQRMGE